MLNYIPSLFEGEKKVRPIKTEAYIPADHISDIIFSVVEAKDHLIFSRDRLSAEDKFIKQELFDNLSKEAKEVILTIINAEISPTKNPLIKHCMTSGTTCNQYKLKDPDIQFVSTKRIEGYFRKKWRRRLKVKKCMEEVKRFVKETCEV